MRIITDRNGQRFEVSEVGGFGVGVRPVGVALPMPTEAILRFRSDDGTCSERGAIVGDVDRLSDDELLARLECR
jgi:hypothetical protein